MKFKRIISAVSAFAMAMSLITVANAAALGGKPSVTATFDGYEKVSDTTAFAYVNITLDMSAAETLSVYENICDDSTGWEEVIRGNGITTIGIPYNTIDGFTFTKAKSTIPTGLSVNATSIAYGPKAEPTEYWVTPVTTVRLALRVTDFDAKGTFAIDAQQVSVDGKNSAENAVWAYKSLDNQITVSASCSIPSYNDWLNPPTPDDDEVTASKTESTNVDVYTFANSTDTAVEGQKVLMTKNAINSATITSTTRFYVTYNNEPERAFGGDIFGKMAQGGGSISVEKLKFGLIVPAGMDASLFSFDIR